MNFAQYDENGLLAQFEGPPITAQQMEDEINSKRHSQRHDIEVEAKFYLETLRGLSEAENSCEKLRREQSLRTRLTDEQSQALITAHSEVLNKCCDFFFIAWHPHSTELLRCLAKVNEMPNRMWYCGIFSLLELLQHY